MSLSWRQTQVLNYIRDCVADFYQYRWLIDGQPADAATARQLSKDHAAGLISASFAGIIGPATVPVTRRCCGDCDLLGVSICPTCTECGRPTMYGSRHVQCALIRDGAA